MAARRAALAILLAAAMLAGAREAPAQPPAGAQADALTLPSVVDRPPPGRRSSAREVLRAAERVAEVREARGRHRRTYSRAFLKGRDSWQVGVYAVRTGEPDEEIAQVLVDDRTGEVREVWTGIQVAWTMARGYPGHFGRRVNAPYVWIPLLVLFVLPFLRGGVRLLHLDLLAVLSLSVSYALFCAAEIGWSVPLAYPPLIYLLARTLWIVRARARPGGAAADPPPLRLGDDALVLGIVFLLGFRVALNLTGSNVIDVGYAGVVGADRITGGGGIYGGFPSDIPHGDTYGPVNYLAYLPFEAVLPWSGAWDELPAAHAAALTFDLASAGLLWLLGRRIGGTRLGLLLAYLWMACPWTLLVASSNSNDALVSVLVLAALIVAGRPAGRGAALAAASLTKFAPVALGPLLATYRDGRAAWGAHVAWTAAGFLAATGALLAFVAAVDGDLDSFADRTIGFQLGRESPFSIWGLWSLGGLQTAVQAIAAALAVAVAFVPRRRDLVSLCALTAAVLIAVQVGVSHWFYLYVVWFLPPLLVALLADYGEPARRTGSIDSALPGSEHRMTTALSHGSSSAAA